MPSSRQVGEDARPRGRGSRASTRSAARAIGWTACGAAERLRRRPRRGRGSGPCPPSPARPSRRRCPRSASSGRRGAGSRGRSSSTPRRFRLRLARLPHVLGPAVDAAERRVRRRARCRTWWRARPGRAGRAIARPTSSSLVIRAVHVGGVEEVDAEVEGAVDGGDRLGLVARRRRTRTCPCSRGRAPTLPAIRASSSS